MPDDPNTESNAPETEPKDDQPPKPEQADDVDAMKAALKKANEQAARDRVLAKEAKALKAELEKLREASQSEQEKAIEAAKAAGRSEVLSEANKRLVSAEVRAAAAGVLVDPKDALAHLKLDEFEVGEDGSVDQDAISAAIADLVEAKPYLAAGATPKPTGSPDGGAREPNQPQSLDDRIAEAQQAGDVRTVLALNAQKLVQLPGA